MCNGNHHVTPSFGDGRVRACFCGAIPGEADICDVLEAMWRLPAKEAT